jgi:aspartate/glutamate racemase
MPSFSISYLTAFAWRGIVLITPTMAEQNEINRMMFERLVIGDFRVEIRV